MSEQPSFPFDRSAPKLSAHRCFTCKHAEFSGDVLNEEPKEGDFLGWMCRPTGMACGGSKFWMIRAIELASSGCPYFVEGPPSVRLE